MEAQLSLRRYGSEPQAHAHAYHQLVLPLSGTLDIDIEGRGERLQRGRLASIASGQVHAFSAVGANRFVVIDLPDELAGTVLPDSRRFLPLAPAATRCAQRLAGGASSPQSVRAVLAALFAEAPGGTALRRVAAALARMRERPWEPHGTESLAADAGLARSRFHALFLAATGTTPQRWLGELRLDRAEAMLRHGAQSLAEVALACGYSEQSALTRALRRERGLTPGDIRRGRG